MGRPKGGAKYGGRDWVPGQSGNPKGRPRVPVELQKVRGLVSEEMRLLITRYLRMNREELQAALGNAATPAVELLIASGIVHGIKTGDYSRVAFLLDRTIGKVKDETSMDLKVGELDKIEEAVGLDTVVSYLRDRKRA